MNIKELIDQAKLTSGMTFGDMSKEIGVLQSRISEWRRGKFTPNAGVLAYFAEKAGLPVLETVAEMVSQQDPRFREIWARALVNRHVGAA